METRRNPFSSLSVIFVVCVVLVFSTCKFFGGGDDVSVTGVSLNISSTSLNIGGTETLIATVSPDDATNQNVTWSTSDSAVATVSSEGVVTAVAAGTAVISVTTEDGGFVAGCDVVVEEVAGSGDVYIAGYYYDSNDVACYWLNDNTGKVILHDSSKAIASSIYVFNGNVYAAGYYTNSVPNEVASYWINDSSGLVDLFNEDVTTDRSARANSIFVSTNGDVLTAGYHYNGTDNIASYWRNNSTNITELYTADDSKAYSIFESGGNVYVAGYHYNGKNIASYWTNNSSTREDLSTSAGSFAYSIYYANGSVYAAGKYFNSGYIACYWVDNLSFKTDITGDSVYLQSIMATSTDVYLAGSYDNGPNTAACYWLNNSAGKVDLFSDTVNSGINAEATSIFIHGTDIYVAGYYTSLATSYTVACYWKNGERTDLTDGSMNAKAYSIFVK